MKCSKCGGNVMEWDFKEYDYNVKEGTMYILINVECEDCEHLECKEIIGKITEIK